MGLLDLPEYVLAERVLVGVPAHGLVQLLLTSKVFAAGHAQFQDLTHGIANSGRHGRIGWRLTRQLVVYYTVTGTHSLVAKGEAAANSIGIMRGQSM